MSAEPTLAEHEAMRACAELVRSGRLAEAVLRVSALAGEGASDAMLAFAAMVVGRTGDAAAAVPLLERLHARRPEERATRLNLAQALIATDRFAEAAGLCLPLAGDAAADRLRAYAVQQHGDLSAARELYRAVLAAHPGDPDSWANLGNVLDALGDYAAAVDAYERAITLRRGDVRLFLGLAQVLEHADRAEERRKVARDAVAVAPDDAAAQLALGLAEAALFATDAAEAALRRAIALAPADPAAYLDLGLLLEGANRLDALDALVAQGRLHLGEELALIAGWAALRRGRFSEAAEAAERVPETIHPARRAHLRAQAAERSGDAERAFALFGEMNSASVQAMPAPAAPTYRAAVTAEIAALREATVPPREVPDDGFVDPVFIVGFPRSGTTLLDTILGGLDATHVLEEQPLLSTIEQEVGGAAAALSLDAAEVSSFRTRYRELLAHLAPRGDGLRIVDKHPLHMARMPLIARLFPDARVLLVERHPCDVLLSCFMANFRLNQAMRSFTDVEEAARTYDAVWTAWTEAVERLGVSTHAVRYERLVADPEAETRAALAYIGAPFDPHLLDTVSASRARGPVRTASYAQITEPIYRRSVERWRCYRAQLAPVLPILRPWVERMGYDL